MPHYPVNNLPPSRHRPPPAFSPDTSYTDPQPQPGLFRHHCHSFSTTVPGVNEASTSLTIDTANGAFRFLHFPEEVLLEIIDTAHNAYVSKEKHDESHPLTNLRL
jgi:hypothetical protein